MVEEKATVMAKLVAEDTKELEHEPVILYCAGFEGGQMPLYRKLPQRGFNRTRFQSDIAVVNVGQLDKITSDEITLQTLKEAGMVRSNALSIKLLGSGEVTKSLQVKVNFSSASASKKIEAAGGTISIS